MSIKLLAISASVPFITNIPLIGFYQAEELVMAPLQLSYPLAALFMHCQGLSLAESSPINSKNIPSDESSL